MPFVNKRSDVQGEQRPRTMNASEEIVWLREHVLKQGPKNNAAYADAAKRLAELHAELYPGNQEEDY